MDYLKIFTDFRHSIEPLDDAERGRLFTAMLEYANDGTAPALPGNERFIWPTAKLHIDRTNTYLEKQREHGARGGRPKAEKGSERVEKGHKGFETSKDKDNDNDKEKEKDNDNSLKEKKEEKKDDVTRWINEANRVFGRRTG